MQRRVCDGLPAIGYRRLFRCFLYLGYRPVGTTTWTRRWEIPLVGITPALVTRVQAEDDALQATLRCTIQVR